MTEGNLHRLQMECWKCSHYLYTITVAIYSFLQHLVFSSWRGHNQSKRCYAKTENKCVTKCHFVCRGKFTRSDTWHVSCKSKQIQGNSALNVNASISRHIISSPGCKETDYDQKTISHYLKAYKLKYKLVKHIEQWLKIMPPVSSRLCTVLMLT